MARDQVMEEFIHPQVDSGFGFTCDEKILPFIKALYGVGMRTLGSCEAINAQPPINPVTHVSHPRPKGFPRRWIAYTHDDPQTVLALACHIRNEMQELDGWGQTIMVDHYGVPDVIFAALEFTTNFDAKMLGIIEAWEHR
jgi:hypothetical protein